jgi:ABC-type branched-subunit amino acid transport system substrate-binding protein
VLHLGDDAALGTLLREAAAAGWRPTVLVPGALAGRAAAESAPGFAGRLFLAFPAAPSDETAAGRARLARLVGEDRAGRHHALQASTAAAAALLLEGLRRAGRQLDREALVRALEGIQGLETGLLPALSYGPGRRIGALGGYVVEADPARRAFRPVEGWRSLE